jgi:general L-amino acid transport system substrate-binding protein
VVAKKSEVATLAALRSATICTVKGTTHEANMESWFRERRLTVTPVRFDNQDAMYDAFFAGKCVAVTQDATALASSIVRRGKAADYMMLPEKISKEPLGPYVRNDDVAWLDVVRWTQYALIEAEELGITADNVERLLSQSTDPAVRRLLGVTPGNGKALGLDEKWAYNIISQVGNYGDSYERNLGMRSPLKLGRGVNALWTKGGLMYALPLR